MHVACCASLVVCYVLFIVPWLIVPSMLSDCCLSDVGLLFEGCMLLVGRVLLGLFCAFVCFSVCVASVLVVLVCCLCVVRCLCVVLFVVRVVSFVLLFCFALGSLFSVIVPCSLFLCVASYVPFIVFT